MKIINLMWRRFWGVQPWEMASKPHESSRTLPPVHSRPAGGGFAVENTDLRFSVLCVGLDLVFFADEVDWYFSLVEWWQNLLFISYHRVVESLSFPGRAIWTTLRWSPTRNCVPSQKNGLLSFPWERTPRSGAGQRWYQQDVIPPIFLTFTFRRETTSWGQLGRNPFPTHPFGKRFNRFSDE